MALLSNGLLPASFRGAPFAVINSSEQGGRRIALHQYPGRDDPWAEDMGRAARRWRFRGFIVDGDVLFLGGPIQLQRLLLISALEKKGSGTLTHPTQGLLTVSVESFAIEEDLGAGRMSSLEIVFVEAGKQKFPSISSVADLIGTSALTTIALAVDGIRLVALAAAAGGTRQDLTVTTSTYSSKVAALGTDATSLYQLTSQLPGNFGRYAAGGNAGLNGQRASTYSASTTISDLVGAASIARVAINANAYALAQAATTADLGYADAAATAIVNLVQSLADACADPADAIRLLELLIAYAPTRPEAATPIGMAIGGMVRRAAAASLVLAVGNYQPTSSDDAAAMIAQVAGVLDEQATQAADAGDDQSYSALRAARGAVVQDLRDRGATLAQITTFRTGRSVPALVLAQRWYRDPTRADQLVTQTSVPSPLFMPTVLAALAA